MYRIQFKTEYGWQAYNRMALLDLIDQSDNGELEIIDPKPVATFFNMVGAGLHTGPRGWPKIMGKPGSREDIDGWRQISNAAKRISERIDKQLEEMGER